MFSNTEQERRMFSKIAKRIICILICVSMIVSVNACSSGSSKVHYILYEQFKG